jgi:hypothetical protein
MGQRNPPPRPRRHQTRATPDRPRTTRPHQLTLLTFGP